MCLQAEVKRLKEHIALLQEMVIIIEPGTTTTEETIREIVAGIRIVIANRLKDKT
jgi:hypothetical protein